MALAHKLLEKIMKAFIIKYVLPMVFDAIIEALYKLAKKSSNSIDDQIVHAIEENKLVIIAEVNSRV